MPEQMPNPENSSERMDLQDAQAEANLMRAKLTELFGREPTNEDYTRTLQYIEELKKLAETESTFKKIFLKVLQLNSKYLSPEGVAMDKLIKIITLGKYDPHRDAYGAEEMKFPWEAFDNAAERLKKLQQKAEKFER